MSHSQSDTKENTPQSESLNQILDEVLHEAQEAKNTLKVQSTTAKTITSDESKHQKRQTAIECIKTNIHSIVVAIILIVGVGGYLSHTNYQEYQKKKPGRYLYLEAEQYYNGVGVERNYRRAYQLAKQAGAVGNPDAPELMDKIEKRLSQEMFK